jgi:hypothetical protein
VNDSCIGYDDCLLDMSEHDRAKQEQACCCNPFLMLYLFIILLLDNNRINVACPPFQLNLTMLNNLQQLASNVPPPSLVLS